MSGFGTQCEQSRMWLGFIPRQCRRPATVMTVMHHLGDDCASETVALCDDHATDALSIVSAVHALVLIGAAHEHPARCSTCGTEFHAVGEAASAVRL